MPEIEHGNVPEGFQNGTFLAATERLGRQVVQGIGQGIAGQVVGIDPDPVLQDGCVLQFQSVVDDKVRVFLNIGINLIHRYLGVERVGEQFPLSRFLVHWYVDVIILSLVAVVVSTRTVDVSAPRFRVRNPRTVPSNRIKVDLGRRFLLPCKYSAPLLRLISYWFGVYAKCHLINVSMSPIVFV